KPAASPPAGCCPGTGPPQAFRDRGSIAVRALPPSARYRTFLHRTWTACLLQPYICFGFLFEPERWNLSRTAREKLSLAAEQMAGFGMRRGKISGSLTGDICQNSA